MNRASIDITPQLQRAATGERTWSRDDILAAMERLVVGDAGRSCDSGATAEVIEVDAVDGPELSADPTAIREAFCVKARNPGAAADSS